MSRDRASTSSHSNPVLGSSCGKADCSSFNFELTPGWSIHIGEAGIKLGARRGERRAETSGSDLCHTICTHSRAWHWGMARMDPERQSHQEEKGSLLPARDFAIGGIQAFQNRGFCSQELAWIHSRKLGG